MVKGKIPWTGQGRPGNGGENFERGSKLVHKSSCFGRGVVKVRSISKFDQKMRLRVGVTNLPLQLRFEDGKVFATFVLVFFLAFLSPKVLQTALQLNPDERR